MATQPELPPIPSAWNRAMQLNGIQASSIHSTTSHQSASNIDMEHFLLLRALWKKNRLRREFEKDAQAGGWFPMLQTARSNLRSYKPWAAYLESFPLRNKVKLRNQGTFSLVSYYQHLCTVNKDESSVAQPKVDFSPRFSRFSAQRPQPAVPSRQGSPLGRAPRTPPSQTGLPDMLGDLTISDGYESEGTQESLGSSDEAEDSTFMSLITGESPVQGDLQSHFKAVEDEQVVNTALVLFLNALTVHREDIQYEWSLFRHPFVVLRQGNPRQKAFSARVDGVLRHETTKKPAALIEVKPFTRSSVTQRAAKIPMQEAAQIAAWIAQDLTELPAPMSSSGGQSSKPSFTAKIKQAAGGKSSQSQPQGSSANTKSAMHKRILISQDRQDIYITIATFDDDYVRYIRGFTSGSSFLELQAYGPYSVNSPDAMNDLGGIMLALTMQGGVM